MRRAYRERALLAWRRTAALALCAFALFAGSGLTGTLCIGEDGHVAFEPARGGVCVDGERSFAPMSGAALAAPPSHTDCGPCIDLASPAPESVSAAQPQPPNRSTWLAPSSDSHASAAGAARPARHSLGSERAPAALSILRGTVLRC